jgi:hypothetical protein
MCRQDTVRCANQATTFSDILINNIKEKFKKSLHFLFAFLEGDVNIEAFPELFFT